VVRPETKERDLRLPERWHNGQTQKNKFRDASRGISLSTCFAEDGKRISDSEQQQRPVQKLQFSMTRWKPFAKGVRG